MQFRQRSSESIKPPRAHIVLFEIQPLLSFLLNSPTQLSAQSVTDPSFMRVIHGRCQDWTGRLQTEEARSLRSSCVSSHACKDYVETCVMWINFHALARPS
jgi:hypothetical protein